MRLEKAELDSLIFENVYDDGNSFWFTEFDYNALFKLDKGDSEAKLVGIFPNERFAQERLYTSTVLCGRKLYFAPHSAKEFAVYDMESKTLKKIKLIKPNMDNGLPWEEAKFFKIAAIDEVVYLIPFYYPGILCYNTKSEEWSCFDDWIGEIEKNRESKWGYFTACEQVENQLILPCACADAAVIFDTITKKSKVIPMPHTSYPCRYCGICYVNHYFYFVAGDGKVVKSKLEESKEKHRIIKYMTPGTDEISYYPIQYMNGFIYLFPFKDCSGLKIDIRTDEVMSENLFDDEKEYLGRNFCFLTAISDKRNMYSITGNSRRFIQYDLYRKSKYEIQINLSEQIRKVIQNKKKEAFIEKFYKERMIEDTEGLLSFMIGALADAHRKKRNEGEEANKIGSKIYKELTGNVISRKDAE